MSPQLKEVLLSQVRTPSLRLQRAPYRQQEDQCGPQPNPRLKLPRAVLWERQSTSMVKVLPRWVLVKYVSASMEKLYVPTKNASHHPQMIAEVFSLLMVSVVQTLSAQKYNQHCQWKHLPHKGQLTHQLRKSLINKQGVLRQRHQTSTPKIQLPQPYPLPPRLQQLPPDQSGPLHPELPLQLPKPRRFVQCGQQQP